MVKRGEIMENKHVEYRRIAKGARVAVLFVHGIMGTPNHFRDLVPLIPDDFSVLNIVIEGHCGSVSDFSHASMRKWENCVERAVNELLETHEEIYVLAHSMGTLLTMEQAMKEPRITRLFYLSVPIKVGLKPRFLDTAAKVYFKRVRPCDKYALAGVECYGITDSKNIFKYLGWAPRFIDLFKKISQVRKRLLELKTPCTAYQSALDEMVSPKSIEILKRESSIKVVTLEGSGHFYYSPEDMEFLKQEFTEFLK